MQQLTRPLSHDAIRCPICREIAERVQIFTTQLSEAIAAVRSLRPASPEIQVRMARVRSVKQDCLLLLGEFQRHRQLDHHAPPAGPG